MDDAYHIPRTLGGVPLYRWPAASLRILIYLLAHVDPKSGSVSVCWAQIAGQLPGITSDHWRRFLCLWRDRELITTVGAGGSGAITLTFQPWPLITPTSDASPAKRYTVPPWAVPYANAWKAHTDNAVWPGWHASRALWPLHKEHGSKAVTAELVAYLHHTAPRFRNLLSFATGYGSWANGSADGSPRRARRDDRNRPEAYGD